MSMKVNGLGVQNYQQKNLRTQNPSFGAQVHSKVLKEVSKAAPEMQSALDKALFLLTGFASSALVLKTGLLKKGYYLENPTTKTKIDVSSSDSPNLKDLTGILNDAHKKEMISSVFNTENNQQIQKLASNKQLSVNLDNLIELRKGEYKEIVDDLILKSKQDNFSGKAALEILAYADKKNIEHVPMIYDNITKDKIVGTGRYKGDPRTADEIEENIKEGNLVFVKDIMKNVTNENKEYISEIIKGARIDNKDCIKKVMQLLHTLNLESKEGSADANKHLIYMFELADKDGNARRIINSLSDKTAIHLPAIMKSAHGDTELANMATFNLNPSNIDSVLQKLEDISALKEQYLKKRNNFMYFNYASKK